MEESLAISRSVCAGWNGAPYKSPNDFILPTNFSAPYESTNLNGPPENGGNPSPNTAPKMTLLMNFCSI